MAARRHRFSNEPKDAKNRVFVRQPNLTERDRHIFELLDPLHGFKYLTSEWIHALISDRWKSWNGLQRRLGNLQEAQNNWLERPRQAQQVLNALYKACVYQRTDRAASIVGDHSATHHRSNSFKHELLSDLGFYAPMRLAVARDPTLRLVTSKQLLQHPNVPETTKKNDDPFLHDIGGDRFRFDGAPFILVKGNQFICVPGVQIDRNTEGMSAKTLKGSSLGRHIQHMKQFVDRKMYRSHFGFQNCMIPIITTSERHLLTIMKYVEGHVGASTYFLFKVVPDIAEQMHYPKPDVEFFTTPWRRVGHPNFSLADFK